MFDVEITPALHAALLEAPAVTPERELRTVLEACIPESPRVISMAVQAHRAPVVSAELQVRASFARLEARVWISDVLIAVIERQAPDESAPTRRLAVADVDAFPRLLAALVDLGPRKRPRTPGFRLPAGALVLVGGLMDLGDRRAITQSLDDATAADLMALLHDDTRRWVLSVAPGDDLADPPTVLDVVDAPSPGLWLVRGDDESGGTTLIGADPSVVWGLMSGLVDGGLMLALAAEAEAAADG